MKTASSNFLPGAGARAAAAAALTVWFGVAAPAATPRHEERVVTPVPAVNRVELKRPDRTFVEKVMRWSMDEVAISRVAAERSSNPRVRELAEAMMGDHARLQKGLTAIASNRGVVLPA